MGQTGRDIVKVDIKPILNTLQAAYADEWLAHYNYLHVAQVAVGLSAPQVVSVLTARAADELAHAQRIGRRIHELGGQLPADWSEIPTLASCSTFALPEDPTDLSGILRVVLEAERCAIRVYKKLSDQTLHQDVVTHELAEDLLADEVKDEEETENLLGE